MREDALGVNSPSYFEDSFAVLTVQTNGTITDFNQSARKLLKFDVCSLNWQHVSTFIPQLSEVALRIGEHINPNLRFLSRIVYHFEALAANSVHFASKLFFVEINHLGVHYLRLIIRPILQDYKVS